MQKILPGRTPRQVEQFNQLLHLRLGKIPYQRSTDFLDGFVQLLQQFEACVSDRGGDNPTITLAAFASNEAHFVETIEQASDIWIPRNHALRNGAARQTILPCPAKDAQHVILRTRDAMGLQHFHHASLEGVGRTLDGEDDLLLGSERLALLNLALAAANHLKEQYSL